MRERNKELENGNYEIGRDIGDKNLEIRK